MSTIARLRALLAANTNPDPEHPDPDSIWIDLADSAIVALPALLDVVEAAAEMRRLRAVFRTPSPTDLYAALDRLDGAS